MGNDSQAGHAGMGNHPLSLDAQIISYYLQRGRHYTHTWLKRQMQTRPVAIREIQEIRKLKASEQHKGLKSSAAIACLRTGDAGQTSGSAAITLVLQ